MSTKAKLGSDEFDIHQTAIFHFTWHVVGALMLTLGVVFSSIFITFLLRADEHVGMVAFLGLFTTPISYLIIVLSFKYEDDKTDKTNET